MSKQACTISRMVPANKEASPLTVRRLTVQDIAGCPAPEQRSAPQPPTRVLAHDMHGQCLSSDQARLGTRGLANHVGVLAGKRDDASKWPEKKPSGGLAGCSARLSPFLTQEARAWVSLAKTRPSEAICQHSWPPTQLEQQRRHRRCFSHLLRWRVRMDHRNLTTSSRDQRHPADWRAPQIITASARR